MLDPKLIRQSLDDVRDQLKRRGFELDVEKVQTLEDQRKLLQKSVQDLQNERNVKSKAIGMAKAKGEDVAQEFEALKALGDNLRELEEKFAQNQTALEDYLKTLPNILNDSVPDGKSEDDNREERRVGTPREFQFTPKDHVELGATNQLMDFATAAKISGARFVILRGKLARLQRALIQFMLDVHTLEHGYTEIFTPYIVNADCLFGTGQLPKFKEDLFALSGEGERYLISTSEITVTNTVRDEIIDISHLPLKYVCYSSCFRSEAGSYGKDMRGMLRQHQFEKVELVQIVHPDQSYDTLETLTQHAESILARLELPYRVMTLCGADTGFASAKTYDIEVWLPGQNRYREISSCSNFENFQARRMKARFKDTKGKIDLVHTLNGSALAVGRTLIAILENYQDELGRIHIPKALIKYMDGLTVIE